MGDRPSEADSDVFGGLWDIRNAFRVVRKIITLQVEKTDQAAPFWARRYVAQGILVPNIATEQGTGRWRIGRFRDSIWSIGRHRVAGWIRDIIACIVEAMVSFGWVEKLI